MTWLFDENGKCRRHPDEPKSWCMECQSIAAAEFSEAVFDGEAAFDAAEDGMEKARRAERVQEWKSQAGDWLDRRSRGSEFTADELIGVVGLPDEGTNKNNVVGALISSWSKTGRIEWTGSFRKSERIIRHGNPQRVWRRA